MKSYTVSLSLPYTNTRRFVVVCLFLFHYNFRPICGENRRPEKAGRRQAQEDPHRQQAPIYCSLLQAASLLWALQRVYVGLWQARLRMRDLRASAAQEVPHPDRVHLPGCRQWRDDQAIFRQSLGAAFCNQRPAHLCSQELQIPNLLRPLRHLALGDVEARASVQGEIVQV